MKLLVDTQCWLWWFAQPERLSEEAIAHMPMKPTNYGSLVSADAMFRQYGDVSILWAINL